MVKNVEKYLLDLLHNNYAFQSDIDLVFSDKFQKLLVNKKFNHQDWFSEEPLLIDDNGEPDYLGTCFYMINSLQEFGDLDKDKFNRFQYKNSYQAKFSCAEENLVDTYFRKYFQNHHTTLKNQKSKVFITHDIDLLNSGLKQDVKYLFNSGKISSLFQLIFNYFIGNRHTRNIDKVMQIDNEYDLKATFFWLVQNEFDQKNKIENGDYQITDKYIQDYISVINQSPNFENGLHKSSNTTSLKEELALYKSLKSANRFHYLKFNPEIDYKKIANSDLQLDTTLGFAENIGFRNSFGLPFKPYDFEKNTHFNFIEAPLQIMDTTFYTYKNEEANKIENTIINYLEKNKHNALITLLWHNDSFSSIKFSERLKVFKNICAYIKENKIESVSASEILETYS